MLRTPAILQTFAMILRLNDKRIASREALSQSYHLNDKRIAPCFALSQSYEYSHIGLPPFYARTRFTIKEKRLLAQARKPFCLDRLVLIHPRGGCCGCRLCIRVQLQNCCAPLCTRVQLQDHSKYPGYFLICSNRISRTLVLVSISYIAALSRISLT